MTLGFTLDEQFLMKLSVNKKINVLCIVERESWIVNKYRYIELFVIFQIPNKMSRLLFYVIFFYRMDNNMTVYCIVEAGEA